MKEFITLLIFVALVWICSRFFYLHRVNALHFAPEQRPALIPIKPSRKWFKSYAAGRDFSLVHLGSGYFAFYVICADQPLQLSFENVSLPPEIFILRKRRGKFVSVDLSDKALFLLLKKLLSEV